MFLSRVFKSLCIPAAGALLLATLPACSDNIIFDGEGDCDVTYSLEFVYDMNLKWADAFPSEVKSINVYVFDEDGLFVKELSESSSVLDEAGYRMPLDLPPGHYTLVGWGGLVNEGVAHESFTPSSHIQRVTHIDDHSCKLNTKRDDQGMAFSDTELKFLFHGKIEVDLPDTQDGREYLYRMPLTKNTNHFRIMLQQVGRHLDSEEFYMTMHSANATMHHDNSLIEKEAVRYEPWHLESNILGAEDPGAEGTRATDYLGVTSDMTLARLIDSDRSDLLLSVSHKNENGTKELFKVPVVQYALLLKKYYEEAYGHPMTDQEYLDRQDEYSMTFFLDENLQWRYAVIEILSWRVVVSNKQLS